MLSDDIANRVTAMQYAPIMHGFFRTRTGNQNLIDASNMPIPDKLYSSLMFEGELTILAADTNVGKSIFAVQIANEIAQTGRKVLYLDLELSDKQFERRYSEDFANHFVFSPNFYRGDFAPEFSIPAECSYDDYFIESLIGTIEQIECRVVVIDNMTRLISTDTDAAKSAKPLMDRLNQLKAEYGLSMLLLEHTRKTDAGRPISLNDMQGSKMKANFADAVFTIGRSAKDKNLRYVKQLKCRSAEVEYDADNVLLYEVVKDSNFLCFKPLGFSTEYEHLQQPSEDDKTARIDRARELKGQGKSIRDIAAQLGLSKSTVSRILK